ncbi:protein disulfide-isomerase A3-like [Haliotis cracherodii]|uniref:protein disulfide-isomerase A3-like n=1 Tax=Haliotis cracherodii TaxID=6455 RepID=UPI0039E944BC
MKIVVVALALIAAAHASDVLEFTDTDFKSKAALHELILVEFFAPWCGHCKKLAPEYEKAATTLKSNDPPVALAKVDCTVQTEVCKQYGVSGYPTLKIFRNGEFAEEYNGPREAGGIVKLMKSKAGPSSKVCESEEDLKKFLAVEEYGVVGFFGSKDDELAKIFKTLADTMSSDLRFAHTYSKDVARKFKRSDEIVIYRPKKFQSKFEDKEVAFDGDVKEYKVKAWIEDTSKGLCGQRKQDNADQFKKPLFVAYYDVDYVKNIKGTNYWRNRVMKVGKKIRDEGKTVYFAISNKEEMKFELNENGIDDISGDKPFVCARDTQDKKYRMEGDFSMETFEQFVRDVLDGKVDPYLKSEAVPEPNDEPVKVLVAKNFDEIVNNKEKDVLIEFYAPWCGHCKSLAPKYDELAEKLKDEPEITIAKMDATANDVAKPYEVSGFPTLYFAPRNSKSAPKKYNGGREVDDFLKYLAKESTNQLRGYDRNGKKVKSKKTEL